MNFHLFARKVLGRPTLVRGKATTFAPGARILNAGSRSDLIRVGSHCRIEGELFVFAHGGQIHIGDWCFIGPGSRIWSASNVSIGHRVLISHNVNIFDSLTHPLNPDERHQQFKAISSSGHPREIHLDEHPIVIGDDVWIGAAAIVLRGVRIGSRAVVGAAAVVVDDVPENAVVAGNPARVIRHLDFTKLAQR